MARILIVYGTTEGQTRKIAQRIAEVAQAGGHRAQTVDSVTVSGPLTAGEHDAVLVGASLHRGRYQSSVERFVRTNLALLNRRPSAFFGVSLVAASRDPKHANEADKLIERFLAETGWRPARSASLAGALPYSRYGFFKRLLMRLIVWREGGRHGCLARLRVHRLGRGRGLCPQRPRSDRGACRRAAGARASGLRCPLSRPARSACTR